MAVRTALLDQLGWRDDKVTEAPKLYPGALVEVHKWKVCLPNNCRTTHILIPSRGPQGTSISNQGREPKLTAQSRAGHSGSIDQVPPPRTYSSVVRPPTSIAKEGPSTRTGRKRERASPQAPAIAPIKTHQPKRLDSTQPSSGLTQSLSVKPSTPTHRSSNATPTRAIKQSMSIPQEQEPNASSSVNGIEGYIFPRICISTTV